MRAWWNRLAALFRKSKLDRDFDEELAAHIDLAAEDFQRQGHSPQEARRRARMKLGGVGAVKELHRDTRGMAWLEGAWADIRYAMRGFRNNPGFTVIAVGTLAIGIGVNVAVFTVADALLFKGFPLVEENDRLACLSSYVGCCVSYPDYQDWRAQASSFEDMALTHGIQLRMEGQRWISGANGPTDHRAWILRNIGRDAGCRARFQQHRHGIQSAGGDR